MNRGSRAGDRTANRRRNRFNEAPIHESGKWAAGTPAALNCLGFNEAPIHESGKCNRAVWVRK